MSGRTRANIRKGIGFAVCALLCTALLASPGAWAQKGGEGATPLQSDQSKDSFASEATAQGDYSDQNEICPGAEPWGNDETNAPDQTSDAASVQANEPAREECFKANIYIANKPYLVSFWVYDVAKHLAAVGTRKKVSSPANGLYYDPVIKDEDISTRGPLEIPSTVTYVKNNKKYVYNVTLVGSCAFSKCKKITSTGLVHHPSIKEIQNVAYAECDGLEKTGLEANDKITTLGISVFQYCSKLEQTGLESNTTITTPGSGMFQWCTQLTSTGLEGNSTISVVSASMFWHCTKLSKTGLESNTTVTEIQHNGFWECTGLVSTGIDKNLLIKTIGAGAFQGCSSLGTTATETSNAGDLVLNGAGGALTVGLNAFIGTHFQRVYLGSTVKNPTFEQSALNTSGDTKIPTLFVPGIPPWSGKETFTFGTDSHKTTYSTSDGSLVIMSPLQSMSAQRLEGTSDKAKVTIVFNQTCTLNVFDTRGASTGDQSLVANPSTSLSSTTLNMEGLPPSEEELNALVKSPESFIYPATATSRPYNTVGKNNLSCELDPVTYTIHFDAHGGSGTMDNQQVTYGRGEKLHLCTFSVDNMTFRHWSTDAQDQGSTNASYDNEALTDNIPPQQGVTLTLFAQWETGLQVLSTHTNSDPLGGVSYELSKTDKKPIQPLKGLSTDPEGQNPIHKEGEQGTCWPLISNEQGTISMYWLSEGTYYLFNVWVPSGYNAASSPMKVEVSHKDGKAFVTVNGNEVSKYTDATAQMSIAFSLSEPLPTTGNLPAGLLQGVGALVVSALGIVALRRCRRRQRS